VLIRARYVFPVTAPIIRDGAVRTERRVIAEVGPARSVSGTPVIDFGDAVVLPGFVNAHTHLELGHLAGRVPPGLDFTDWLERLLHARGTGAEFDELAAQSAREGVKASLRCGVTTVGDITRRPDVVRAELKHGPLRVVSFGEVIAIGRGRDRLGARLDAALDRRHASREADDRPRDLNQPTPRGHSGHNLPAPVFSPSCIQDQRRDPS